MLKNCVWRIIKENNETQNGKQKTQFKEKTNDPGVHGLDSDECSVLPKTPTYEHTAK